MKFHEVVLPDEEKGMAADVALTIVNDYYPVALAIPPLTFDILVKGCSPNEPYITLADATTELVLVQPEQDVTINVGGIIRRLPDTLTQACPGSLKSPMDALLGNYMNGRESIVYVRGSASPSSRTPEWIIEIVRSITVPLPFPGHEFDNLIRDFSLANVHFGLPSPFAEPDTPEAQPSVSAIVKALVSLPKEMNFPIDISRVRADADVYYKQQKLGELDLTKWQKANATCVEAHGNVTEGLAVESVVKDAPLQITDNDVFADLVQALVFGGKSLVLGVKANVDVETETALGQFVVRDIPTEGKVFVKR